MRTKKQNRNRITNWLFSIACPWGSSVSKGKNKFWNFLFALPWNKGCYCDWLTLPLTKIRMLALVFRLPRRTGKKKKITFFCGCSNERKTCKKRNVKKLRFLRAHFLTQFHWQFHQNNKSRKKEENTLCQFVEEKQKRKVEYCWKVKKHNTNIL